MNKLLVLNKWREYAADIRTNFGSDILQNFIENSCRNSRQSIAKTISRWQKLNRIVGSKYGQDYNFLIDQYCREDRFYRIYDC
jgi:hypothetical protein